MTRLVWGAAWGATVYGAALGLAGCQESRPGQGQAATAPSARAVPSSAASSAAETPPPPWYVGTWSLSSKPGAPSGAGGGSAVGPSLQGSVVIDESRQVTGSLERTGNEPGMPLTIRGSLLDESLRFEATSLTERALVLAERSGEERSGEERSGKERSGKERSGEQPKRFIGSLSWAKVDGSASSRSSVEVTPAAPSTPSNEGAGGP